MNKIVQDKIINLEENIRQARLTNDDVDLVESLISNVNIWIDYEVNVSWHVRSMDEVKAVLKLFAKKKVMIKKYVESDTMPMWYLTGKNVTIRLVPEWTKDEGASCRLVRTGTKTVEYPEYKLVCDEATS